MYKLLWAKSVPYKSLLSHMLESGIIAQRLLESNAFKPISNKICELLSISQQQAQAFMGYIVACHDIGKCHPYFQASAKVPETQILWEKGMMCPQKGFRHEIYSRDVLKRIWKEDGLLSGNSTGEKSLYVFLAALRYHHQGKQGSATEPPGWCGRDEWLHMQRQLEGEIRSYFAPDLHAVKACAHMDALGVLCMGVVILSDWISSDNSFFTSEENDDYATAVSEKLASWAGGVLPCSDSFSGLYPQFTGDLRGLQQACQDMTKDNLRLAIIEAPMGEGKTETAMYMATHMIKHAGKTGFYIAMPTQATGNQMYTRVNELLEKHDIGKSRLLHGMAWLVEKSAEYATEDEQEATAWMQPMRRALLSQYAVGTVDQAMMSVLYVKYGVLRLLGLSCATLIIDEIHAYDSYMSDIIEKLLQWCHCLDIPVILLSATLPSYKRKKLLHAYGAKSEAINVTDTYPLITTVDANDAIKETPVERVHMKRSILVNTLPIQKDIDAIAAYAAKRASGGGCICLLVNTVPRAQQIYKELTRLVGDNTRLMLFHARFTAERRQELEEQCISLFGKAADNRPESAILVCTQVVEQSLDLDFDFMISDMAPIDLVLQRLGRLHRHDGKKRPPHMAEPKIAVLSDKNYDYKNMPMYDPLIIRRTQNLLGDEHRIDLPGDMRALIEAVYSQDMLDGDNAEEWAASVFEERFTASLAKGGEWDEPSERFAFIAEKDNAPLDIDDDENASFRAVKTRMGDETMRIAIVDACLIEQALAQPFDAETARKVLLQSCSLRASDLKQALPDAMQGEGLLKGCCLLPGVDGVFEGDGIRITADKDLGICLEMR